MLRLSRLSPARPFESINVRFTARGHANPHFLDRASFIDPSHPAAKLALRNVPTFVCPQFTLRAIPNAILHEPTEHVPINPLLATGLVRARTNTHSRQKWWSNLDIIHPRWHTEPGARNRPTWITIDEKERHRRWDKFDAMRQHLKFIAARQLADARVAALAARGKRNVNLLFHTSKKVTSKSSVIRRRLRSKVTAAIALVVGRNADAIPTPESDQPRKPTSYPPLHLVSLPLQDNETLVLQDWTYLVVPDLTIYKTPLPNLVQVVRRALLSLNQQSKRLEASWSGLTKRKPHSPQRRTSDRRPSLWHADKAIDEPQSVTRTRTRHPRRLHPVLRISECVQGSDAPRKPDTNKGVRTHLDSDRPVIPPYKTSD